MEAHVGPVEEELVCFRKPRSGRRSAMTRYRHRTPPIDRRNQVIYQVTADGGGCAKVTMGRVDGRRAGGGDPRAPAGGGGAGTHHDDKADGGQQHPQQHHRKGRPRGSKNKHSVSNLFNYRCEKKSFAYESVASAECKACGRTFVGDPTAHCVQHHEDTCPVCGGSYRPPLAAHIKSHGVRQPTLTVTCYECYECKEKFGNAETMTAHVLDEHVLQDRGGKEAPAEDVRCALCDWTAAAAARAPADDDEDTVDTRTALVDHVVGAHCPRKTFNHPAVYRCRVCQAGFKSQINVLRHACNKIKTPHCALCGKTFPSKMRYSFHLQFHEHPKCPPMHLHCDICLAEFEDEYQLYDHIRFRHELHDKAVCEICGRTFKSSMGLNIHRRYHNGSRNFTCKSCDKSFLNKSTLKEHEISHMDVKPFQCHICGQYLSRASRLRSHVKTHKAAESTAQVCYCCRRCGFVAPNPDLLEEHLNKEHDGIADDKQLRGAQTNKGSADGNREKEEEEEDERGLENRKDVIELPSVVKCEFCDSTYMDAVFLNNHRTAAHANCDDSEAFICVVCSSTFSTYSRLTTHKLTHGINMESALVDSELSSGTANKDRFDIPQYFSCQYCAKKCLHYTYFCLHRRLKHPLGVQTHTCDRCFLEFKTSWRLSYHKKTVHGQPSVEKPSEKYKCSVCSRKFIKIGALNLHKTRTHIDMNGDVCKYLCHRCGKFFSSECSLRNHSKMHTYDGAAGGAKGQNNRAITTDQRNRRRTYRKSTSAIKPATKNSCPYCNETTEDKAKFIEHVNRHIQSKPAVVSQTCRDTCITNTCSDTRLTNAYSIPWSANLTVFCDLCDKRFPDAVLLNSHLGDHAASNDAFLCTVCYKPFLSSATYDVHRSTECNVGPDVKFVGSTKPKDSLQQPALVVECSEIFNGKTEPCGGTSPEPTKGHENAPLIDKVLDSSLLDELLSIMTTPFDQFNLQPIDNLDDIFNSLQSNQ